MKVSTISIGDNCTLGPISTILYDSQLGDGSCLYGLALLMKGEHVPPSTSWQGSPARSCHNSQKEQETTEDVYVTIPSGSLSNLNELASLIKADPHSV